MVAGIITRGFEGTLVGSKGPLLRMEIVKRSDDTKGFVVLPRRRVVDTFVRAIEATKKEGSRLDLLQILTAGNYDEDNSEDNCDAGDYEETGDYEEADDCDS